LGRFALSLPSLGCVHTAARAGGLSCAPPDARNIALPELELRAAGLDLAGSVSLGAGGGACGEARFHKP